ncbi:hypothetical protein K431DRAFT_287732 [Polychaeton citri CBS 116435]|uniref:ATPase inhibitor, mitochondrial n=1 Tax=Polychaeton citri CBS 116435 TaxID=1314669 RepID=A0A9P4Q0I1_9PEZI|nr:hypothetical protein K431DRAFT_287732 [Polychaeton citri CBS 116435]
MTRLFSPFCNALRQAPRAHLITQQSTRLLSISAVRMGEGDTGGIRYGGAAHGDAFNKREKAAEDLYIRQREADIVKLLKEKIAKKESLLEAEKKLLAELEVQYGDEAEEALRTRYSRNV